MKYAYIKYEKDNKGNQTSIIFNNKNLHIDGYVAQSGQKDFFFPIGDGKELRGCIFSSEKDEIKVAYYNRNPSNFTNFFDKDYPTQKDSNNIDERIIEVSKTEFWDVTGELEGRIMLTSNRKKGYSEFEENFNNSKEIIIAGFDGKLRNLGKQEVKEFIDDSIYLSTNLSNLRKKFNLITFASADSLKSYINLTNSKNCYFYQCQNEDNLIKFNYSFGYYGNGIIKIYDFLCKEIYSDKIYFNDDINYFEINKSKMLERFYFIQIISEKNDILNAKIIN